MVFKGCMKNHRSAQGGIAWGETPSRRESPAALLGVAFPALTKEATVFGILSSLPDIGG
jgi:hypothetical protein